MEGAPDRVRLGNGRRDGRTNGSNSTPDQGSGLSGGSNGMHKSVASLNGSSENGENGSKDGGDPFSTYHGHNREEVTRLLIQTLSDMGYQSAAEMVSQDSGYALENPTVTAFRNAVLLGSWSEAERLLMGTSTPTRLVPGQSPLVLNEESDPDAMCFWMRQQKYLELLEKREVSKALRVLRNELEPIHQDRDRLHFLSGLMVVDNADTLKKQANWDGAEGQSRKHLLSELSKCISPSVMLPENRLVVLLEQVKQSQINHCMYHTEAFSPSLYSDHTCDRQNFPTEIAIELEDLPGEVWQVQFSHDGSKLAACGDSESVFVWETHSFKLVQVLKNHELGVGNISWSPDDTMIVSCSSDKYARLWDVESGHLIKRLRKFEEPATGCAWAHDSLSFVVGSLDKNSLCTFYVDRDEVTPWVKKHRVQDLCGSPDGRWLVAVDDLQKIHIYNGMTKELEYEMDLKARPTSVNISEDSRHLLVNKKDGETQLIDLVTRNSVQKFEGHTGGEYLIRSAFGGANESFIISGSEDGNILIWHKKTGITIERLPGHQPRCNAVSWNPSDPCMLASCGDDRRVKIWSNRQKSYELRARHPARTSNGWSGPEAS